MNVINISNNTIVSMDRSWVNFLEKERLKAGVDKVLDQNSSIVLDSAKYYGCTYRARQKLVGDKLKNWSTIEIPVEEYLELLKLRNEQD